MELNFEDMHLPDGIKIALETLSGKYELVVHDRQGGNGYIFKAKNRVLGNDVAIKFYYWGGENKLHFEPQTLTAVDSPHVLKVFDAGFADDEHAYFVTPFCSEGDLDQVLQRRFLSSVDALDICSNVLTGLGALHARRLVHRDLKPANIYLHQGRAIIGDFGSIAALPKGNDNVPASRHAVLYRPPESIDSNTYGMRGDVYQCGIVLYQLLGGSLPYEESGWLSKIQRTHYDRLQYPENTLFADQCVRERIVRGRLLDFGSLSAWASDSLKRISRKATNVDPSKRFVSAAEFLGKLMEARSFLHSWKLIDNALTLEGDTSYRILLEHGLYKVQKRRASPEWRNDNSIETAGDLRQIVKKVESRL